MTKFRDFSDSALNNEEEQTYLKKIFDTHFDKKYKERYAKILEDKHQITRDASNVIPKKSTNTRRILLFVAAAAAVFLLFFMVKPLISPSGGNLMELTNQYASAEVLLNKDIKRGEVIDEQARAEAIQLYNSGKYTEALSQYGLIDQLSNEDVFWVGMSHFNAQEYQAAETQFASLADQADLKYKEELKWYYALTLLQNGKNDEAKEVLQSMISWKGAEVKKLLGAME